MVECDRPAKPTCERCHPSARKYSDRLRFAERQHEPVRPSEQRHRVGEVRDISNGEAYVPQRAYLGGKRVAANQR